MPVFDKKTKGEEAAELASSLWGDIVGGVVKPFTKGTAGGVAEGLWNLFEPLGMYSPEAQGMGRLPKGKKAYELANKLGELFHDWYKGGDLVVNMHRRDLPKIVRDEKLKNQMELTTDPRAWNERVWVERDLFGIPKPNVELENLRSADWWNKLDKETPPPRNPKEARKHPIYGHIYNPKYQKEDAATYFGKAHGYFKNPLVREESQYVLGDSFGPMVKRAFTHKEMMGEGSALERAIYKDGFDYLRYLPTELHEGVAIANMAKGLPEFMEAIIPNRLAKVNAIDRISIPKSSGDIPAGIFTPRSLRELFDRKGIGSKSKERSPSSFEGLHDDLGDGPDLIDEPLDIMKFF